MNSSSCFTSASKKNSGIVCTYDEEGVGGTGTFYSVLIVHEALI